MSLINDALKRARQAQKRPATSPTAEGTESAPTPLQPVEDARPEKSQKLLVVIPVLLLLLGASFWFLWKWKNAETKALASAPPSELTEVQSPRTAKTNALAIAAATMAKWQARQESVEVESPTQVQVSAPTEAKKTAARPTEASIANEPARAANASSAGSSNAGSAPPASPVAGRLSSLAAATGIAPALPSAGPSVNAISSDVTSSGIPATTPASPPLAINTSAQNVVPVPAIGTMPEPKLQGIFYRLKRPTAVVDGRIVSLGDEINGYRVTLIGRDTVKMIGAGRIHTLTLH